MAENSKERLESSNADQRDGGTQGKTKNTANRGFASMDPAQQREIARKGGEAVSGNREHMSQIGKKGGEASRSGRGA